MGENTELSKPPKKIKFEGFPLVVAMGGMDLSKDMKISFIEKGTGMHYTIRIIPPKDNRKLILDIHATDEKKKNKAIKEGRSTKEAYESIIKMTLDIERMAEDGEKIGRGIQSVVINGMREIKSEVTLKDSLFLPLPDNDNPLFEQRSGRELYLDERKFMMINGIRNLDNLERKGFTKGIIYGESGKIEGSIFKREGKWYFMDIMAIQREITLLLFPYMTIEGKITKNEIIKTLLDESEKKEGIVKLPDKL
ncbi:MAG: hypothetical protein M0Z77_08415 [Thermoplasmatales archaeon]|jgi:hypothetical protein|nr:hypothetical protein [Candidatus Thermoplasmatota archaeon]MCL6002567.1 hypothetical protein [Candidatus Thermoplasmatota archaeon]MDA8055650.1 hypothetical protein [Thermoplasmatales archaeon]